MATATRSRRAVQDEDEETAPIEPVAAEVDDEEEEEEEEEEQAPARGRASASPPKGRAAAAETADDDDDVEDDDDDDDAIIIGDAWNEAAEPSGESPRVDRGPYVLLLDSAETRRAGERAKNPGAKYGVMVLKIRAEDNPDVMDEDASTVTIWHSLFFTPASLGRTKKTLRQMDITVSTGDNIMEILSELADEEALFNAVIGVEKYRGEDEETGKEVTKRRNKVLRFAGRAD